MGFVIFFLVLALVVLIPVAIVNGIRYRRLKYICLCEGIQRGFSIGSYGVFHIKIGNKKYTLSEAYGFLRQPSVAEPRLRDAIADDEGEYKPGSWKLKDKSE